MKKIIIISFLLFFSLLFTSCKKEVPSNKSEYVGEWHSGSGILIRISQDGSGYWEDDSGIKNFIDGRVKFTSQGFEIKGDLRKRVFTVDVKPVPTASGYYAEFGRMSFTRN